MEYQVVSDLETSACGAGFSPCPDADASAREQPDLFSAPTDNHQYTYVSIHAAQRAR